MMKHLVLAALLLVSIAVPAWAQDMPPTPKPPDVDLIKATIAELESAQALNEAKVASTRRQTQEQIEQLRKQCGEPCKVEKPAQ